MLKEMRVVIVVTGSQASGKTRAIDAAVEGIQKQFSITSQLPMVEETNCEIYTFTVRPV